MNRLKIGDEVRIRESDFPSAGHVGMVGIVRHIDANGPDDEETLYGLEVPGSRRPLDEINGTPWYYFLFELEQL